VSYVRYAVLIRPFLARLPTVRRQIRALREYEKPHWVEVLGARERPVVLAAQLAQPVLEALLVLCPLAREEDEAVEHHAGAEDGDVFYGFLEDDVEVAVHVGRVGCPPKVYPIRIDLLTSVAAMLPHRMSTHLVVRNQDHALREIALQPSVLRLAQLAAHALVAANAHGDGRPPVRHGGHDEAELLLRHGHPGVEPVLVIPVQRGTDDLRDSYTAPRR
jgi:hypothetical protein